MPKRKKEKKDPFEEVSEEPRGEGKKKEVEKFCDPAIVTIVVLLRKRDFSFRSQFAAYFAGKEGNSTQKWPGLRNLERAPSQKSSYIATHRRS